MARGRPRKYQRKAVELRKALYIMPDTARRLNIYRVLIGVGSQDAALAAALDKAGAPSVDALAQLAEVAAVDEARP
jgi:hypothetical protein